MNRRAEISRRRGLNDGNCLLSQSILQHLNLQRGSHQFDLLQMNVCKNTVPVCQAVRFRDKLKLLIQPDCVGMDSGTVCNF
ncbi:hypothetical protein D3C71_1909300 [compost metagenome]